MTRATISVHMKHGHIALVNRDDYEELRALSVPSRWFVNVNSKGIPYVRCQLDQGPTIVARLIVRAKVGEIVKYHDGDRFNLTRDNLFVVTKARGASVAKSGLRDVNRLRGERAV